MANYNFEEIGNQLVCFHVSRASWASPTQVAYKRDVESFNHLVSRLYCDYYGTGIAFFNDVDDNGEYLDEDKWTITDCNGNVLLKGRDEIEAETGTIDFDGEYDKWYVQKIEDCDENELELIYNDGSHHNLAHDELMAYCCHRLDKKMIVSVQYEKGHCIVKFADGTDGTITFNRDEKIDVTIEDFFFENDIDKNSSDKYIDDIRCEYEDIFNR